MRVVIILILIIVGVSMAGFNRVELVYRYQFNAWQIKHRKEYIRLLSHGFFHGSWGHLLINMFVMWSFGGAVLYYFEQTIPANSSLLFVFFFLSAIVVSSLYSYSKEKDNYNYNAVGASGGVSALVFASILYNPYGTILVYFIPVPGILLGVGYLIYSRVMAQRGQDNIGHDAHFFGAVYGLVFPILFNHSLFNSFIAQLFFR